MESLDFTQPILPPAAASGADVPKPLPAITYDAQAATAFFKDVGATENAAAGKVFFREREQRGLFSGDDRMYLLLEGAVGLTIEGKSIDTVKPGEIFGEMTSLTNSKRSATATAKTDCRVIALDGGQFKKAIQRNPDFLLMLMSLMVSRFRLTIARLAIKKALPEAVAGEERRVFDDQTLKKISAVLDHPTPLRFAAKQVIISPGDAGVFMYFPREGRVAIMSEDRTLQHVGVGSVFGEMALIDSVARSAKVVAESECVLMAVNRTQFLKLIQSMPEVGLALLRLIAQRLQIATAQSSR
jgi:CRP-like cAMP-binding protein